MNIEGLPDLPSIDRIAEALWAAGDVRGAAVMVGAGFSRFATPATPATPELPLWRDFERDMVSALELDPASSAISSSLRLAEQYQAAFGRPALETLIRNRVRDDAWMPGSLHEELLRLPWADVLTTNWDTLLERVADSGSEQSYEPILVPGDIARTRAPRITKLHGTFPSLSPFIFTEEDFRTYPSKYAPFVNLAQQILLENELCLLGFSGDDPNFLQWSGWVRDHLGDKARRIHLVGVFDMPPSQRRMLEQRNVSVIDLAPLVAVADPNDRHRLATEAFLVALRQKRPIARWKWQRAERPEGQREVEPPEALLGRWRQERATYPGWLVAPQSERYLTRLDTERDTPAFAPTFADTEGELRNAFVAELVWRCEVSLWGLPDWIVPLAEAAASDRNVPLSRSQSVDINLGLARRYREIRNTYGFFAAIARASPGASADDGARVAYERYLWARERLDYIGMEAEIEALRGSDPAWAFRRAAALAEVGRPAEAAALVRTTFNDIKTRRIRDRRSIWLLSREAWARFLSRMAWHNDLKSEDESPWSEWPHVYAEARCDPWNDLRHIDGDIEETSRKAEKDAVRERSLFDAGSRRIISPGIRFRSYTVLDPFPELRRLADQVSIVSFPTAQSIAERLERAALLLDDDDPQTIWSVTMSLHKLDGAIDSEFDRVRVARLDISVVEELIACLRGAVDFGCARIAATQAQMRDASGFVERMRIQLELLSRLVARLPDEQAMEVFDWAEAFARKPQWNDLWLFEAYGHLLGRSLLAMSPKMRAAATFQIIRFPFASERGAGGPDVHWPTMSETLMQLGGLIERPKGMWDARIAELLQLARSLHQNDRTQALIVLLALHRANVLADSERQQLAEAAWSVSTDTNALPGGTSLYPHVFLELPEPEAGRAATAFRQDVVGRLRQGKLSALDLQSLAATGIPDAELKAFELARSEALELVDSLLEWRMPDQPRSIFPSNEDHNIAYGIARALAFAAFPAILPEDLTDVRVDRFVQAATSDANPLLALAAPAVAIARPDMTDAMVEVIRHAMVSNSRDAVQLAYQAGAIWLERADAARPLPLVLFQDVLATCYGRTSQVLHSALALARRLIVADMVGGTDVSRLAKSLGLLFDDLAYENQASGRFDSSTLSLVRMEAVRLAHALRERGHADRAIDCWLTAAAVDPLPEVRFALSDTVD